MPVLEVEDRVAVVDDGRGLVLADRVGELLGETVAARDRRTGCPATRALRRNGFRPVTIS
ncbi:MAG TPA: hypothetical protein VJH87_21740 [Vicinamibacteria bacterium]|nr:hypothetical protein [Vicinamibacteria bacterium]